LTARVVFAATLVMLVTMTFRIPFGLQAIYAFGISRESPRATVRAVMMASAAFALATGYVIVGAMFAVGDPMLHLLWVMATLFIAFYAIATITDYATATGFGILAAITIPLWDRHVPAELRVENTLWAAGQTIIAGATAAVAGLLFAGLKPADNPLQAVAQRLAAVEGLLNCYAADCPMDENSDKELKRMAVVGTSRLRRLLRRSTHSPQYREQMAAVVSLVGRLVDIAANLRDLTFTASDDDRQRMRILAENIAGLRADLLAGRIPRLAQSPGEAHAPSAVPLLWEMEQTVALITGVSEGSQSLSAYALPSPDEPSRLFRPDTISNPAHVKFALKGCLAASLCYIIYTALDWPEISTAVVTCVLTALTTIGASRQKQLLRFTGALAGGLVGIAALVSVLPYLDSIAGFTVLFCWSQFRLLGSQPPARGSLTSAFSLRWRST
jgi:multidrug resistance protein MdtO